MKSYYLYLPLCEHKASANKKGNHSFGVFEIMNLPHSSCLNALILVGSSEIDSFMDPESFLIFMLHSLIEIYFHVKGLVFLLAHENEEALDIRCRQ